MNALILAAVVIVLVAILAPLARRYLIRHRPLPELVLPPEVLAAFAALRAATLTASEATQKFAAAFAAVGRAASTFPKDQM